MNKTKRINWPLVAEAIGQSFRKLSPRAQLRNPVMFVVYSGSLLTTFLWLDSLWAVSGESSAFILGVSAWLWLTVLFANFAEATAEGTVGHRRPASARHEPKSPLIELSTGQHEPQPMCPPLPWSGTIG